MSEQDNGRGPDGTDDEHEHAPDSWISASEAAGANIGRLPRVDVPDTPTMARWRRAAKALAVRPTPLRPLFARWLRSPKTRDA